MLFLYGCGTDTQESSLGNTSVPTIEESRPSNQEIVENILEDNPLSDDEMFSSVKEYWENFNKLFEYNGEDITVEVANENGEIVVYTTQNGNKQETTRWTSVQEAFSYLAENALVDLTGKVKVTAEDMISEFETGKNNNES